IAPAGNPTSGSQPSVGWALPSSTSTIWPENPSPGSGPKSAPEAWYVPAADDGGSTTTTLGRLAALPQFVASVSSMRLAWRSPSPEAVAPCDSDATLVGKWMVIVRSSPG